VLTTFVVASCVLAAALFTVIASWMRDQALHRSARANLGAAGCCLVAAALAPFSPQTLPATVLVCAAVLGATSLRAARAGRG
jgi:hypothetical protein